MTPDLNPKKIRLVLPNPTPPALTSHPIRRCPTCVETRDEPVYCAPGRCYCLHPKCPAYKEGRRR